MVDPIAVASAANTTAMSAMRRNASGTARTLAGRNPATRVTTKISVPCNTATVAPPSVRPIMIARRGTGATRVSFKNPNWRSHSMAIPENMAVNSTVMPITPGDHDGTHAGRCHGRGVAGHADFRRDPRCGIPPGERPRRTARVPPDRIDRRGVRGARDRDRIDHQRDAGLPDGDELPRDAHLLSVRCALSAGGAAAGPRRAHAGGSAHLWRRRNARPADREGERALRGRVRRSG